MVGVMETIIECFRACHVVIRAPFAYVIRKMIIVQIYGNHPNYATPDDEMITRILHLPTDKNMLLLEHNGYSVKECTAEYKIENRSDYDIWIRFVRIQIYLHMSKV